MAGMACRITTRVSRCAPSTGHRPGQRTTVQQKLTMSSAAAAQKAAGRADTSPKPAVGTRPTCTRLSPKTHSPATAVRHAHGKSSPATRPLARTAAPIPGRRRCGVSAGGSYHQGTSSAARSPAASVALTGAATVSGAASYGAATVSCAAASGVGASGATTSGGAIGGAVAYATTSGSTTSGGATSGATTSGATTSGATTSGATTSGGAT